MLGLVSPRSQSDRFRPVRHLGMVKRILILEPPNMGRCSQCHRLFVNRSDDPSDLNRQFEAHHCKPNENAGGILSSN